MNCPRCAGTLYEDEDYAGRFLSCLACGELIPLDGYDPTGERATVSPFPRRRKAGLRGATTAQRHPRA